MKRRHVNFALAASALSSPWLAAAQAQAPPAGPKVLRYAFRAAETSFDPAKVVDIYSRTITPHIFEALYRYDHLARPVKIKPLTAAGMPEVSDEFRTWTVRVTPGIFFPADPAFKGQRRELVAQDYVYSLKRFADPVNKSPVWGGLESDNYLGFNDLRKAALATKKPFDYDTEIEGLRAIDRYTFRIRLEEARPRYLENL
ncbi:MAG: ABC transporter substrate-binding protein, partial [Caldimonas sp.]